MSVGMIMRLSPLVYEPREITLELDVNHKLADLVTVGQARNLGQPDPRLAVRIFGEYRLHDHEPRSFSRNGLGRQARHRVGPYHRNGASGSRLILVRTEAPEEFPPLAKGG